MPAGRPRVLVLLPPGAGDLVPVVPTSWALRTRGAEIVVGATGPAVEAAVLAGLPTVDLHHSEDGEDAAVHAAFRRRAHGVGAEERDELVLLLAATLADRVADAAVALGQAVRPDVVLHTPTQPLGTLVAAVLGVPAIEHGSRLVHGVDVRSRTAPLLGSTCARHGLAEPHRPDAVLDICPPSLRVGAPAGRLLGLRTADGGRLLSPGFHGRPHDRPVVLLAPGATRPHILREVVRVLAARDVDVLLLGTTPGVVGAGLRVVARGRPSLDSVLPRVDAVVHDGDPGPELAALAHGVPQLVVAPPTTSGRALVRRGLARWVSTDRRDRIVGTGAFTHALTEELDAVLDDDAVAAAAREVAAEIAATPGPSEVVLPTLDDLLDGALAGDHAA